MLMRVGLHPAAHWRCLQIKPPLRTKLPPLHSADIIFELLFTQPV